MKTIKELLEGTELLKRANILILNDNNAIASIEDHDEGEFESRFYFLQTDGTDVYVMKEFGMDKSTLKVIFNSKLKEEGVIVLEDKGGVSIYDFENDEVLVLDNLFTHAYDSYEKAYDEESTPNFLEEDNGIDSFGKYIICSIDFEFEYPNINYGLVCGIEKVRLYLKFYYETSIGFTPIKIYDSLEKLKGNVEPLKDLGNVTYQSLRSDEENLNPLVRTMETFKKDFEEKLISHKNCLILIEEAKAGIYYGSLSEDVNSFQTQVKLRLNR